MDDEALFRRMITGDETALAELVARYHSPIFKFLYRYTGDRALADDMAQETFMRLMVHRGTPPKRFRSWLYTIAANLARDHFRSAHYRYEQAAEGDVPYYDAAVGESEDVLAALAKLTPDHREVVILRFYHDLKLEEIAEVTHVPLGTVKSRLFHALKTLIASEGVHQNSVD